MTPEDISATGRGFKLILAILLIYVMLFGSFGLNNISEASQNSVSHESSTNVLRVSQEHDFKYAAGLDLEAFDVSADNRTAAAAATVIKPQSSVIANSGSNRYVAWTDYTTDNGEVLFKRSTDNGATWKATVNLTNNPGHSINVAITTFGSNVYVTWTQYNLASTLADIYFRGSTDNGAIWGAKIKLSSSGRNTSVLPQITASGSSVYVAWSESRDEIYFRRSPDNGSTWQPTVNLSNNNTPSTVPQIAAFGSDLYVVWQDYATAGSNYDILFRRSTDSGATWKSTTNLSSNAGDSLLPRIAIENSNVYVVWDDLTPGNYDILFRRSTDSGATWKSIFNVSKNFGESRNPQIVASDSNVYVAWEQDNTPFTLTDVYFRGSTDNGATWGGKIKLSSSGDNKESFPQIAASGSSVYVAWSESRDEIHFRRSPDNGSTWQPTVNLSSNEGVSNSVYIVSSGSNISVVWNDLTPGNYDILFRRSTDNGATWKSTINLSNNSGNSFLTRSYPE